MSVAAVESTSKSGVRPDLAPRPGVPALGWSRRHVLGAAALAGAGVLATLDAWSDLAWRATHDEEASHVLLVPLIAAWLVYVRRSRLARVRPGGFWVGPALVAAGGFLYWYGDTYFNWAAWHLGAVAVALGAGLTTLGADALRRFLPAVLVLAFMVPLPGRVRSALAQPLQTATARVTQTVLEGAGSEAVRSGNLLSINGVDVTVAEACAGMRMTHALLLVSYAFAFATPLRWWVRALVIALSPVFAVLCNVLRLIPTVWSYGEFSADVADAVHDLGGWVMLFVGYFLLTGLVRAMEWLDVPIAPRTPALA